MIGIRCKLLTITTINNMSEQPSNSLVEGEARKQFESELLDEYLDKCHFYAIISICLNGILPRFEQPYLSSGDRSISRSDLIGRYKFTPDYSIIGTWNYKDFIQNVARYDYDKLKEYTWKEFIASKISQHLKLTTSGDPVGGQILVLLIDQVITADPLYKFFNDLQVTNTKIDQGDLGEDLSSQFQILVRSLAGEVTGRNLHEGFDPRIQLVGFARLLYSEELPENFCLENQELLKQLIQLLLSETDVEYFSQGAKVEGREEVD